VVRLVWSGSGKIERTVCIAGKGVTYDVGGADIKVGGSMAGMRRDKCGAAAAAGFILSCARAAPELTKGLKVVVELGCVRNSIGADAFVADEVISGHAGKRVLIGNTDAEGRLVLADVLSHLRSRVTAQPNVYPQPVLLSLATLTGHATRSFGPYACATDSGAARAAGGLATRLAHAQYVAALQSIIPEDGRPLDAWVRLYTQALDVLPLFDHFSIPKELIVDKRGRSFLVRALAHPDDRVARAATHALQRLIVLHLELRVPVFKSMLELMGRVPEQDVAVRATMLAHFVRLLGIP
jgi:leucyl aminopeptidase